MTGKNYLTFILAVVLKIFEFFSGESMQNCDRKFGDYFRLHKLLLRICGISLQSNDSKLYRIYSILLLCLYLFLMIEEVYTTILIGDINEVMTLLSLLLSQIVGKNIEFKKIS